MANVIRIVKSWTCPDLLRQSPGGAGQWNDCHFTLDPVDRCDCLIVLNHIPETLTVEVPPERVWCFVQEPPVSAYRWMEKGFASFSRVFTPDATLRAKTIIRSHGSLPWHVGRSYDELVTTEPPAKSRNLSWITSNASVHEGHRRRLGFLKRLKNERVELDLYGRGFVPLADKWDGLAPYRYSIAVENHSCPHYWTEKIADCFLAWTMPLYFGATNIGTYFPEGSFVWIDIDDPSAPKHVAEILKSDLAERRRDEVAEARRRVLEEHQFFPRVERLLQEHCTLGTEVAHPPTTLQWVPDLTDYYLTTPPITRFLRSIQRRVREMQTRS